MGKAAPNSKAGKAGSNPLQPACPPDMVLLHTDFMLNNSAARLGNISTELPNIREMER